MAVLVILIDSGCARSRGARRLDLGALTPPVMLGSRIRSQDGARSPRIPRERRTAPVAPVAQNSPRVQWSGPLQPTSPEVSPTGPPSLVTLPPPPPLPESTEAPTTAKEAGTVAEAPEARDPSPAQPAPEDAIATIQKLVSEGRQRLATLTNYQVQMERQERVGGELQPTEQVVLSIRRDPRAVRLEWPSGKNQGREVLFSTTETAGQIQILMPGSLIPRLTLAPDSPLVLRSSRHPIQEAGFDAILDNLEKSLRPHLEGTPTGAELTYQGVETPEALGLPCHKIVEKKENGEVWVVYLDAVSRLPASVKATDARGELLEHYLFRDLRTDLPELAQTDAFDPATRWANSGKGFLSRMARSNASPEDSPATSGPR